MICKLYMMQPIINQLFSYSDTTKPKGEGLKQSPEAYCTSYVCEGLNHRHVRYSGKLGVLKHVSKQTISCPDCHEALFWYSGQSITTAKKE